MRRTLLLTNAPLREGKTLSTLQHTHKPQVLTDPLEVPQDLLSEVKGDHQGVLEPRVTRGYPSPSSSYMSFTERARRQRTLCSKDISFPPVGKDMATKGAGELAKRAGQFGG